MDEHMVVKYENYSVTDTATRCFDAVDCRITIYVTYMCLEANKYLIEGRKEGSKRDYFPKD